MRTYLEQGSLLKVPGGIVYKITGEPIGEGGGSIIYPALRMLPDGDGYKAGHILYAIKECFPESDRFITERNAQGEIIARDADSSGQAELFLAHAKQMQLAEEEISGKIYAHAFRLTPVLESFQDIELAEEEASAFRPVHNMISIMESLTGKGESVGHALRERGHLVARDAFAVIRQVLFAVREVHQAGYLHLDIQDGNVFIKGVLDEGDNMISLIDFGSARPRLEDGLCREISDGLIYSTRGFSAPEILLHNDGHLRLGPQADIFSIGCLLLLLLTGRRHSTTEITANSSGRYIPRFAIRKTACPGYLVDRMQKILARALKTEPSDRYASADDMIKDIEEMLSLLAPQTNPLSAVDYDAFICYKHGEKDDVAARVLRNELEHFHGKSAGGRRIGKVFLDEGELSSCADFGERINQALKNSQWLLVLCSERTKGSKWVNEEIKTFLKYHDKSHVLCMVIEGEPEAVFPEELVKQGFTADNLFAADVRAADSGGIVEKIKGDGKLRIAAPILQMTYDALKQRNKIYRMQRAFAAASIVLCGITGFSAFAAVKAHQIAKQEKVIAEQAESIAGQAKEIASQAEALVAERDEKLANQAALLVEQAKKAYDLRDYAEAEALAKTALELLGDEFDTGKSALVSEIKHILVECKNLYVWPEEAYDYWISDGVFREESGADISFCHVNADGSRLFTFSEKAFCAWDTKRGKLVSRFAEEGMLETHYQQEQYLISERDECIFWGNAGIRCFNYETGELVWRADQKTGDMLRMVLLSEDRKTLYRVSRYRDLENKSLLIETLDAMTGEVTGEHAYQEGYEAFSYAGAVSLDGRILCGLGVEKVEGRSDVMACSLWCFDLEKESASKQELGLIDSWSTPLADGIFFTEQGNVCVSEYDGAVDYLIDGDADRKMEMVGKKRFLMYCYDVERKELIWSLEEDHEVETDYRSCRIPIILKADPAGSDGTMGAEDSGTAVDAGRESVFTVAVGNILYQIREDTGEILQKQLMDDMVVSLIKPKDSIGAVLENGTFAFISGDNCLYTKSFSADTRLACYQDGVFYVSSDSEPARVVKYSVDLFDADYREELLEDVDPREYVKTLPADDRILEQGEIQVEVLEDGDGFRIVTGKGGTVVGDGTVTGTSGNASGTAGSALDVATDEAVHLVSLMPDGKGIVAGFENTVALYALDGSLISEMELDKKVYSFSPTDCILYFLEEGSFYYGNKSLGYLIDWSDEGLVLIKGLKHVVGFDHKTEEFLICDYMKESEEGCLVGRCKYHKLEDICRKSTRFIRGSMIE